MIDLVQVQSSTVIGVAWRDDVLYVLFKSKVDKLYKYTGVPRSMYDELMAAPSKGKFITSEVKKKFAFGQSDERFRMKVSVPSMRDLLPGLSFGF